MSDNAVLQALRQRRTVHEFEPDRLPPREAVLAALEVARWAPNHHLTQPWHVYWLGPQTIHAIAQLNAQTLRQIKGDQAAEHKMRRWLAIPGWLVVTCERSDDEVRAREDYAACACAIQNLMLALHSQGVASKWSTGPVTRDDGFYDLIWADPAVETVVGIVWYGYPAEIPQTVRAPVERFLVELP